MELLPYTRAILFIVKNVIHIIRAVENCAEVGYYGRAMAATFASTYWPPINNTLPHLFHFRSITSFSLPTSSHSSFVPSRLSYAPLS